MKFNWKSIFRKKSQNAPVTRTSEEADYDKRVNFFYTNLINSLILFSLDTKELEKLAGPVFNPISELESEIDIAFLPLMFETIFRNNVIDLSFKEKLLLFKKATDEIPSEIWDWEFINTHPTWIAIRKKANVLLDELGVKTRIYNDDYITIVASDGKIIKSAKKTP